MPIKHEQTKQAWEQLRTELAWIAQTHPDAVLASSMGVEDMLLVHALASIRPQLVVIMLDTGRLHSETLNMVGVIRDRYGIAVQTQHPDKAAVEAHVAAHGTHAFYDSVDLRRACCHLRKIEPLNRALAGRSAWITGQRREQSATRTEVQTREYDHTFGLQKFNPLALWTTQQIWDAVHTLDVPYNPLHDQGYPSIGCEPCTRAVRPGEDPRAGRWWWEQRNSRECGLHAGNLHDANTSPHVIPRHAT